MAKVGRTKRASRLRSAGGRITLKPCSAREEGQYCAPLNHIISADSEYWTCSCGRRYRTKAYKEYVDDHPDWRPEAGEP